MTDPRYWLWLSLSFTPGSAQCDRLLNSFNGNPKAIFDAPPKMLSEICRDSAALKALEANRNMRYVESVLAFCERNNIGILTQSSQYYPKALLRITGSPPVIYYKGRLPDFSSKLVISVVGTRDVTDYGKRASYTISNDLAHSGAIVVSGMAKGTDTYAHRGALDAGGHTIAFLGCGIDVVYPKENEQLMNEIILSGTVMTDFAPGQRPEGWHFPVRNRLISGISHGVLVVEAAAKSGALITASHALSQGKYLYAVPGKVGELASVGTNDLISKGATIVTGAADIIKDFTGIINGLKPPPNYLSHTQKPFSPRMNINMSESQNVSPNLQAAQPRPRVIYSENAESKTAGSYMSLNSSDFISIDGELYGNTVEGLIYPDKVPPQNGYTVELTSDKIKYFEKITTDSDRNIEILPPAKAKGYTSGKSRNKSESDDSSKKLKSSENTVQYDLSENEIFVLNYIKDHGRVIVDSLIDNGKSYSDIILALTSLECKKLIVQLPGGYFEIPEK